MVVQHNLTAMNSNRMLGITTSAQAKSTEKLSSGYKINRAADDAAGLSISEKMRKQIRGLSQASLNAEDGISAVQTAEGALTEVHDMLQRMNELAVKSANGTNSVSDRDAIQAEIDQLSTEIDRVAETTKFNETYLLKGNPTGGRENTVKYKTAAITATPAFGKDGEGNAITKLYKADGTEISAANKLNGTETFYKSITSDVSVSNENLQATLDAAYAHQDVDKVYTWDGTAWKDADGNTMANVTVTGDKAVGDTITISAKYGVDRAVSGKDYTYIEGGLPALYDVDGNKISENALDEYFNIDAAGKITMKTGKTLYKDKDGAKALASNDFTNYIEKKASKAAGLDLSLHVGADATLNNQIGLRIEAMDAKTLGVAGLRVDGATDKHALDAIETIKAALQKVSNQRSELGAVQNRLEHTINNLDNVVENTTSAESQIRDTDMASEMVTYSKNQILAQAGQSMLAQANQANQGVLSLLQ